MANVAVIGSQWGDEGKGKIVDWLSERADVVVRFQGGHNAGHTLVIDGEVYKLSLLPSGIVRKGKLSVIGNGVVFDPWAFVKEVDQLKSQGVDIGPHNLKVAENTTLILPFHSELDELRESGNSTIKIGTTKRGIGPAYEDKVGRRGVRVQDLISREQVEIRVDSALEHHNTLRRGMNRDEIDREALIDKIMEIAPQITPYMDAVWKTLNEAAKGTRERPAKRILFEGAQGTMLDGGSRDLSICYEFKHHCRSSGIGVREWGHRRCSMFWVLPRLIQPASAKVLSPQSCTMKSGQTLGEKGHEFGVVTGRKRRCGWFDAVLVRQAVQTGGISGIALTKLDVLDGFKELKVCVGYKVGDKTFDYLPASSDLQAEVEPIYEAMEGWSESTCGARSWAELPATCIKYVRRIEELIGAPVALLSTSPERDDTILVRDPFDN